MFTKPSKTVVKTLPASLGLIIFCLLFFISCPMAPPEDPAKGLNPYLSPAAPIIESVTNGLDSSITIRWNESPNATSYEVWGIPSSDFGTIDIPPFYKGDGDNAGYDPAIKGFQFFGDIEETSYTISNLPVDSAFVFCLRAVRDLGDQVPVSNRLLYSSPSVYVEGSTKGTVALQVLATTKSVKLLWNVVNLFKALPEVSGAQEPLYSCSFDVLYRASGTSQFVALPNAEGLTSFSYSILTSSNLLDTRNTYDFQVRMTITTSLGTSVYVSSDSISVQPEQNLIPEHIASVEVSQGVYADGIEITWKTPAIPIGMDPESIFIVERQIAGETDWFTVLDQSSVEFDANGNPLYVAGVDAYVWKDTTAADNTTYRYRVWNGYRFGQVIFLQDEFNGFNESNITESSKFGWKIWQIEGVVSLSESNIIYCDTPAEAVKSETVTLTWNYGQEFNSSVTRWFVERRCWDQMSGSTTQEEYEISPEVANNLYTYSEDLILAGSDDPSYQKTYSYTLKIKLDDGTVFQSVNANKTTSLGQPQIAYFDTVSATKNLAKSVKLSWVLHKEKVQEGAAVSDTTIWNDIINGVAEAITYTIKYSDNNSTDNIVDISSCTFSIAELTDESTNEKIALVHCLFTPDSHDDRNYRISAKLRNSDSTFNSSDTVVGRPLSVPTGLTAAKGISQKSIALSWDIPSVTDDVVYRLYRKSASDESAQWVLVGTFEDPTVAESFDTIGADTSDAGAIYEYALDAYNSKQSSNGSICTDKSTVVQGCLFGAKLINVQASDATDPSKVVITWDGVIGATKYKVMRRQKGTSDAFYSVTAQNVTADNDTYTADDIGIVKLGRTEQNQYPLSAQYDYIVQPIRDVEGEDTLTVAENHCPVDSGFLFAPPENIRATVSRSVSSIDISWDPVKKLDGNGSLVADPDATYIVYSIDATGEPTSDTNWGNPLKTVNGTSTTHSSLSNAEKYYNVVAVKKLSDSNQMQSEFQKAFPDGKTYCYGATLNAPASLSVSRDKVKGITKVSWKSVPNVVSYVVYGLPGIESGKVLDVSGVTKPGTNNGQHEDSVGFIELDGDGAYTYCLAYAEYKDKYMPIQISSKNTVDTEEYESGKSSGAFFRLTALEILNLINSGFKQIVAEANRQNEGDWWKGSDNVISGNGWSINIIGSASLPTNRLNITLFSPVDISIKMKTTDSIGMQPYSPDGWAGHLGTDPLKIIGSNNTSVLFVSDFKDENGSDISVKLVYKSVDATASLNSADKFELTVNEEVIPSSELSGEIVMPY